MARFVPGYPLLVSGHTTGDVYVWELPVSQAGSRTDHHLTPGRSHKAGFEGTCTSGRYR